MLEIKTIKQLSMFDHIRGVIFTSEQGILVFLSTSWIRNTKTYKPTSLPKLRAQEDKNCEYYIYFIYLFLK